MTLWTPQKTLTKADHDTLVSLGKEVNSVLEFGPGESTKSWLEAGVKEIVSLECHDEWRETLKERFKDENVKIDFFTDTVPVEVPDWVNKKRFDIAFVDSPRGVVGIRKVHKGMEDCSRLNTCLKALELAPVVYLHDCIRPLERGTLARLNSMGHKIEWVTEPFGTFKEVKGEQDKSYGIARIICRKQEPS